jgi:glycosyltransferase involved in cell wall biosynthesis
MINKCIIIFILIVFELKFLGKDEYQLSKIPNVSVFLPIYNKASYLFRSIKSIQSQTLKNIEIVAINDGSTDDTLTILKKMSKKDNRIKIINNDRNHGLLFSRAKGIINSRGEYLMNLDPDDKFESNNDLETLYNHAKKSNLDYIIFLIKRVPRYESEAEKCEMDNRLQLQTEDFLITNKFVKKEIFVKAYSYFYKEIYKYKWNFHEDNIWNILVRKFGKRSEILNQYIYNYKRNKESLNMRKNSLLEIKNRIYRLKTLLSIIKNSNLSDSYLYYNSYYQSYKNIYNSCNNSLLKEKVIRNNMINLSTTFLEIYNNRSDLLREINYIMNTIFENKIIVFYNSFNSTLIDQLTYLSINKFLIENIDKKLIYIDISDNIQTNQIVKYIFSNDIFLGLNDIIIHFKFAQLIQNFDRNKIILLVNRINNYLINDKNFFYPFNLLVYSFNVDSNDIKSNKLYCIPGSIINLTNFYYYKKNGENINNNLVVLYDNYNDEYIKIIKKMSSKYLKNLAIFNLKSFFQNTTNIPEIIEGSKLIITDNINIMELSLLYFTKCFFFGNITANETYFSVAFHLNYFKYINNINEMEYNLNNLENNVYEYDLEKDYKLLKLELKK